MTRSGIKRCKKCKTMPSVKFFGKDNIIDIFCPSDDRKCYPGAWVTGKDHNKAIDHWNQIYGDSDDN